MVLQPIFDPEVESSRDDVSAWGAVEQQQTARASDWWLITQPDHAALSGEIARHFSAEGFPRVDPEIVHAIAMHDAGWSLFESDPKKPPQLHPDGRPLSFFEVAPRIFLQAWTASVDRAQEDSALGGYMVSQHFAWLGEYRLRRIADPPQVREQINAFLAQENRRQLELKRGSAVTLHWDELLPLLQFCDLFSLFVCSGARQAVEFPQEFAAGRVRAHFEGSVCVLSPTPFGGGWNATFKARRYPGASDNPKFLSISLK